MNRRILPFSLVVCGAILAYACSSKDSTNPPPNTVPEGGTTDGPKPDDDSGTNPDGAKTDSSIPPSSNPIEGIANPTDVAGTAGIYTEGPVWRTDGLYYSTIGTPSHLVKYTPPSTFVDVHAAATDVVILGNAYDSKTNTFVSCESNGSAAGGPAGPLALVRTPGAGGAGTPIALNFDGGVAAFNAPNDIVARKDGTLYVTDPGYQDPGTVNNHLWRVTATNNVFETIVDGRPNGIALSPDEKTLYVSFTEPAAGLPTITKYALATDGSIGAGAKFADVNTPVKSLDGLAVDTSGNVYAAVKNGVDVFKADGTKWPTRITTTKVINGVAFGGTDKKTLFMTSDTGLLQVTVKIAGIE